MPGCWYVPWHLGLALHFCPVILTFARIPSHVPSYMAPIYLVVDFGGYYSAFD